MREFRTVWLVEEFLTVWLEGEFLTVWLLSERILYSIFQISGKIPYSVVIVAEFLIAFFRLVGEFHTEWLVGKFLTALFRLVGARIPYRMVSKRML